MQLPFTTDEFFNVFKAYNEAVFPLQLFLNIIAITILFLIIKKNKQGDRTVSLLLSFLWIWIGIVYHLIFFTGINKAAYIFGSLFIIQGLIFFIYGGLNNKLSLTIKKNAYSVTAFLFIFFSLIFYPLTGFLLKHFYPYTPTFGLPCPTTIFTFGILLLTEKKIAAYVFIIPFLWSLIGFSAVLNLKVYEDTGLLAAGVIGTIALILLNRKKQAGLRTI